MVLGVPGFWGLGFLGGFGVFGRVPIGIALFWVPTTLPRMYLNEPSSRQEAPKPPLLKLSEPQPCSLTSVESFGLPRRTFEFRVLESLNPKL